MMAVAPDPGMPMVSSGIMAPPTEAVAAACGATMPSGMPVPISLRRRPYCASTPYERNEAMVAPAPGTMPIRMPRIDERANEPFTAISSDADGSLVSILPIFSRVGDVKPRSRRDSTSPRP